MSEIEASVLITGGTGGLGTAVVGRFLSAGWRVVAPCRDAVDSDRLTGHDALETPVCDLFVEDSVRTVAEVVVAEAGRQLRAVISLVGGFAMSQSSDWSTRWRRSTWPTAYG